MVVIFLDGSEKVRLGDKALLVAEIVPIDAPLLQVELRMVDDHMLA
jgi:hypothetical protein